MQVLSYICLHEIEIGICITLSIHNRGQQRQIYHDYHLFNHVMAPTFYQCCNRYTSVVQSVLNAYQFFCFSLTTASQAKQDSASQKTKPDARIHSVCLFTIIMYTCIFQIFIYYYHIWLVVITASFQ